MALPTISESYCAPNGRLFSFRGNIEQVDENLFRPHGVVITDKQLLTEWPLDLGYLQCDRAMLRDLFRDEVRAAIDKMI
jgi:hypothetical protein